ncbi:MAG: nitroreductase family protein [Actinomycetota bacterium]
MEGVPQVVVVFVLFTDRVVAKYGAMGRRFALMEVGHAAQNLALRLAADGLGGCQAGGVVETEMLGLLGLDGTPARVALAYACGLPA